MATNAGIREATAEPAAPGRAAAPVAASPAPATRRSWGPGAYALGAPIALADLLALPPDGQRYGRDERGRLIVTPPDDAAEHRVPISSSLEALLETPCKPSHRIVPEASIAFQPVYSLAGTILPESHHGPKCLATDLACLRRPESFVRAPKGHTWFAPESVVLAVEFLSPSTWRSDLGDGDSPEEVDRWRTYLEARVPEMWVVNATAETLGLPPRSGLFLGYDAERGTWSDLPVDGARFAPGDYRGRRPVVSGRVRSLAIPGAIFDLDRLWRDCGFAPPV